MRGTWQMVVTCACVCVRCCLKMCRLFFTEASVKTKWRNLRDQFNKEYKKIPKPRSGASADSAPVYPGKWSYFHAMLFLKDIVTPREAESNFSEDTEEPSANNEEEEETRDTEDLQDDHSTQLSDIQSQSLLANEQPVQVQPMKPTPVYVSPESVRPTKKIKKKKEQACPMSDFEAELLKNEQEKISLLKEREDDDMYFFKSLLPFFKEMNPI